MLHCNHIHTPAKYLLLFVHTCIEKIENNKTIITPCSKSDHLKRRLSVDSVLFNVLRHFMV